ncbi:rhomboid family intramembrane serine protease [bacterium SCSIO 12741]|nr:rhomboid family intramembrane serine protease [bacterium SCSIO 12741]
MEGILLLIIAVTAYFTYKGLQSYSILNRYMFLVDGVLRFKQYDRMVSSGFLHVDWIHFAFNMFALYSFGISLMRGIGVIGFLVMYFASMIGGNLLALFVHRSHGDYSAVGASGAVSGLVFASIFIAPGAKIGLLFIPIGIPAWIFGCLFLAYSIYGIKNQRDRIGHEAHLGGALVGLVMGLALVPQAYSANSWVFWLLFLPTVIFIFLIHRYPNILLLKSFSKGIQATPPPRNKFYRDPEPSRQQQLDALLDKIQKKGIENLTQEERDRLKDLTDKI